MYIVATHNFSSYDENVYDILIVRKGDASEIQPYVVRFLVNLYNGFS